jgi:hypothetical protein
LTFVSLVLNGLVLSGLVLSGLVLSGLVLSGLVLSGVAAGKRPKEAQHANKSLSVALPAL